MSGVGIMLSIGATGLIAGGVGAGIYGASGGFGEDAAKAAKEGSGVQVGAANEGRGVLEGGQQAAFADLDPYARAGIGGTQGLEQFQGAGVDAVGMQRALAGLDGPEAQQAAIAQLEASPQFAALMQQGESSILANASATGGLRGGNTQAALAQFRPALLSSLIEQQYARLGGLAGAGQNAASNLAGIGQGSAAAKGQLGAGFSGSIADMINARGAYQAGGIIGETQARLQGRQQAFNMGTQVAGAGAGLGLKAATGGVL